MTTYTSPPKILLHPANESASAFYRLLAPAATLRMEGYGTTVAKAVFLTTEELKIAAPDVVVFQYQYSDAQISAIKRYRKALPKATLVYDLDDLLWEVSASNPAAGSIPSDIKSRVKKAMGLCDVVTTSTPYLASVLRASTRHKDIRVLPNYLPARFINEAENGRRTSQIQPNPSKPRVGYAGGDSHADDIAFLKDVIVEMADSVNWVFMGHLPEGVEATDPNIEFHPAVPLADYPGALGGLNLDLAIAPLQDNEFNRCKSPLKVLEYGACGYAVLADNVEPYAGLRHVWHTKAHTVTAWTQALHSLVGSRNPLTSGERLNEVVKQDYRLDDHLVDVQQAWLPRQSVPFVPGANTDSQFIFRPGTVAPEGLKAKLEEHIKGAASVACLHNEGLYPIRGQFADVPTELAIQLADAADFAAGDPVPAPYPTGPAVLLSSEAVSRLGPPNVGRYGDIGTALLEWGARAAEMGLPHVLLTDTFVSAAQPVARSHAAAEAVQHMTFWYPFLAPMVAGYEDANPLATARRNVELSFIRREFSASDAGKTGRILLINPGEDAVKAALDDGIAFVAALEGHYLHFTYPQMPNVPPIDTREPVDAFIEVLARLAVSNIHFGGIGEGTFGAAVFMADVAETGWSVDVADQADVPPASLRVSSDVWNAVWARLADANASK